MDERKLDEDDVSLFAPDPPPPTAAPERLTTTETSSRKSLPLTLLFCGFPLLLSAALPTNDDE